MFKNKLFGAIGAVGLLFCFAAVRNISAQSIASYTFSATSGTFTPLSGATVLAVQNGDADDGYYTPAPIGFTFRYNGTQYTQATACSNGWMSFAAVGNYSFTNTLDGLSGGPNRPFVAPLFDDLNGTGGTVSYQTTGTGPNRVFTMQWLNVRWDYQGTAPAISFQVKLYETSNRVQFIYRQEAGAIGMDANSFGASIGLAGTGTGSGNFRSLNNSGTSPTASSTTETRNISTKPATGQTYTFAPVVTAGAAAISGRVTTDKGKGLFNAVVKLTDSEGLIRTARTTAFGYYKFDGVMSGQTYIVSIESKKFQFEPQVVSVTEDLNELNFFAQR